VSAKSNKKPLSTWVVIAQILMRLYPDPNMNNFNDPRYNLPIIHISSDSNPKSERNPEDGNS